MTLKEMLKFIDCMKKGGRINPNVTACIQGPNGKLHGVLNLSPGPNGGLKITATIDAIQLGKKEE